MKVGNNWKRRLCSALLAAAAFCFCLTGCAGQTASPTAQQSEVSTAQQTEHLMLLCRVWGYVKYRHPAYLLGQRDWDADLLELIPQVQAAGSASEFAATILRNSDDTVLVGEPTAGTDGNVVLLPLPGGAQMGFASLGCYELDGSQSQQVGITPDIQAPYTVQGIKEGRDEPLEAALHYLASQQ